MTSAEDCRSLAAAALRHEKDRPDNAVHARECAAYWDRCAEVADQAENEAKS